MSTKTKSAINEHNEKAAAARLNEPKDADSMIVGRTISFAVPFPAGSGQEQKEDFLSALKGHFGEMDGTNFNNYRSDVDHVHFDSVWDSTKGERLPEEILCVGIHMVLMSMVI